MSPRAFCRRVTSLGTVALSLCVSHWCVLASVRQREGHRLGTASSIGRLAVDHSSTSNQIASAPPHLPLPHTSPPCLYLRSVWVQCAVSLSPTPHPDPLPVELHTDPSSSQLICCAILTGPLLPPSLKKKKKKRAPSASGPVSSASVSPLLAVGLYS